MLFCNFHNRNNFKTVQEGLVVREWLGDGGGEEGEGKRMGTILLQLCYCVDHAHKFTTETVSLIKFQTPVV